MTSTLNVFTSVTALLARPQFRVFNAVLFQIMSDSMFVAPAVAFASQLSEVNKTTYFYSFEFQSPVAPPPPWLGQREHTLFISYVLFSIIFHATMFDVIIKQLTLIYPYLRKQHSRISSLSSGNVRSNCIFFHVILLYLSVNPIIII